MFRTSNPALSEKTWEKVEGVYEDQMTVQGAVNKTLICIALCFAAAILVWNQIKSVEIVYAFYGAIIAGAVVAFITCFKHSWAPVTAPLYAILEGVSLGIISAILDKFYPGIAIEAITLTFGVLLVMLVAYTFRVVKATEKFKMGVFAATGAIFFFYLACLVLNLFGVRMPYIHESGPIGIGFSVVVIIIAALNLVLDFSFIDEGASKGLPKYMEWFAAFGLMVTLVWLYIEILSLLRKLKR